MDTDKYILIKKKKTKLLPIENGIHSFGKSTFPSLSRKRSGLNTSGSCHTSGS